MGGEDEGWALQGMEQLNGGFGNEFFVMTAGDESFCTHGSQRIDGPVLMHSSVHRVPLITSSVISSNCGISPVNSTIPDKIRSMISRAGSVEFSRKIA